MPLALLAALVMGQAPAPARPPKTAAQLVADLDAGRFLTGEYRVDRPVLLGPGRAAAIGDPVRRARITADGTAFIAGLVAPQPPAEMWRRDGGLRLGSQWKVAFPFGRFSFPGWPPKFWADLERLEVEIDCAMASWDDGKGTLQILCGVTSRDEKGIHPAPIAILAGSGHAWVFVADASGTARHKVPLARKGAGDRNKIKLTLAAGALSIQCEGQKAQALKFAAPLGENVDGVFQINSASTEAFGPSPFPVGEMTLHGFRMAAKPSAGPGFDRALTMPAKGDWYCAPDGLLLDAETARRSMASPRIRIANLEVASARSPDRAGASILLGYTQHGIRVEAVDTWHHAVGVGSLGPCYPVELDGYSGNMHGLAALSLTRAIAWGRRVFINRPARDGVILRGGKLALDGGMFGPSPTAAASFRVLAMEDPMVFTVRDYVFNYEGIEPSEAHVVADGSLCPRPNGLRIALRDCTFGTGKRFARLVGAKPGGHLELDNTTAQEEAPTIDRGAGWTVQGDVVGFGKAAPKPPR